MKHTNEIAIQLLSEEYSDYEYNHWHYNREYKMLVKAIELSKVNNEKQIFSIDEFSLEEKFTKDFFKEFKYDSEFRNIFNYMLKGLTPYEAIEHLCKTKKELLNRLNESIMNNPVRIILTPEKIDQLVNDIDKPKKT